MLDTLVHWLRREPYGNRYWHRMHFSELAELYTSVSLKSLAVSLVGIFVPVYLYELGYSIPIIALFHCAMFTSRLAGCYLFGQLIARRGAKHVLRYSHVLLLVLLMLLYTLPQMNWPLALLAVINGLQVAAFLVSFYVDFSKARDPRHEGRQIGNMFSIIKLSTALGPLAGGLIAASFGLSWSIVAAIILLLTAIIPLLSGGEVVRDKQQLSAGQLFEPGQRRSHLAWFGLGMDHGIHMFAWPLWLAVFVFTQEPYAGIGVVTSLAFFATIISSVMSGRLIDTNGGARQLLNSGLGLMAFAHLLRPFVGGFAAVSLTNVTSDLAGAAAHIPLIKGYLDTVDQDAKRRVARVVGFEMASSAGMLFVWLLIWLLASWWDERSGLALVLMLGAVGALLISLQRFKTLQEPTRQ